MRYEAFRAAVRWYLKSHRRGATWKVIRTDLGMPYRIPCPTWVRRLEGEIGLVRTAGSQGKVWSLSRRASK